MNVMINNNNNVLENMIPENNNPKDEKEFLEENNEVAENSSDNVGQKFNLTDYEEKSKEIVGEELSGVKAEQENKTNTGNSEVDNYLDKLIPEYHKNISDLNNILNRSEFLLAL